MSYPRLFRTQFFGALSVLALAGGWLAGAAAEASPLADLDSDDRAVVEAFSLYDPALRRDALEAVGEADVFGALVRQQERSSATFRRLLEPYDRQVQEDLFELARYPELVAEIVEAGPKSQGQLEAIAVRYPDDVAAAAVRIGRDYWKVIARTDALLRDESAAFESSIAHLPERKRNAFRSLVAAPDLLALLAENTGVAVLLGDAFEREPDEVLAWLDELQREVSERGSEDARELAQAVDSDEELADEITASTDAYQDATGNSAYALSPARYTQVSVNVSPFPYWVGFPWWYASTYAYYDPWYFWYPRISWSFGGVYFGPRFYASFGFGWPHGAFWGWYFHTPRHHHYYPRLTHHLVYRHARHFGYRSRYYRQHDRHRYQRRYAGSGRHAVDRFVRDTEGSMPRGFLRDDGRRVERFREYGRLHEDGRREGRGAKARRANQRGEGSGALVRRARADRERYPRLASLARNPERSGRADWRESKQRMERRQSRRDAGSRERRDERRKARAGSQSRGSRVERDDRGGRDARARGEAPGRERSATRRGEDQGAERQRSESRKRERRAEPARSERRAEPARSERRRDAKRVAQPRVERASPDRSRREVRRASRPHRAQGSSHRGGRAHGGGRGRSRR